MHILDNETINDSFKTHIHTIMKDTGIGWLLNDRIKDPATSGLTQNLLDFQNIKYKSVPQCAAYDFKELCNMAINLGLKNLLIVKQGCILHTFIDNLERFVSQYAKDAVLIGHILDRGDEWWQIHPQTLFIDLEWWAGAGKPEFGEKSHSEWETLKIIRSKESLSGVDDSYNPISITASNIPVKCSGAWEGHTLLHAAVAGGQKIAVWNKEMRLQKQNLYAEMNDHGSKLWSLGEEIWTAQWYATNTENMSTERANYTTSTVFSTGGGISPLLNAYQNNLVNGGHLFITDLDPITLIVQSHIWDNWDGRNYAQFIRDFVSTNSYIKNHITKYDKLDEIDEILDTIPEFVNWWSGVADTFKVRFRRIDVMNIDGMIKILNHQLSIIRKLGGQHIFIDVSNAFNYEVNAIIYSRKIRFGLEKDYVSFFEEHGDIFKHKGFTFHKLIVEDEESRMLKFSDGEWKGNRPDAPKFPWIQKLFPWQQ
jgi:hypothetical protein